MWNLSNKLAHSPPQMNISKEFLEIFVSNSNAIENEKSVLDTNSQRAWDYLETCSALTAESIKKAHGLLMNNKLTKNEAGVFREVLVWVGSRVCPEPKKIPELVEKWLLAPQQENKTTIIDLLKSHLEFELIHPFVDGNGRIGRLLFLWECRRHGIGRFYFDFYHRGKYYKIFANDYDFNASAITGFPFLKNFHLPNTFIPNTFIPRKTWTIS